MSTARKARGTGSKTGSLTRALPPVPQQRVTVKEFMRQLGYNDLNREYNARELREQLLLKLAMTDDTFSLVKMPFVIKAKILSVHHTYHMHALLHAVAIIDLMIVYRIV